MNILRLTLASLAALFFIAIPLHAENATFTTADDIPITASSYDAAGQSLNVTLNFAPPAGTNLTVIRNTGLPFISGEFSNVPNGSTVNLTYNGTTYPFVAWYFGGDGNDLMLLWPQTGLAAWGRNSNGQLGDGTLVSRSVPVAVKQTGVLAGKTIVRVAPGASSTMVITSEGKLYSFGVEPSAVNAEPGVSALAGKTVVAVSQGSTHFIALCSDGTVAVTYHGPTPRVVNAESGSALFGKTVVAVAAGDFYYSLALCSDGTLVFISGDGIETPPFAIDASAGSALFGKSVVSIAYGRFHRVVLSSDGTVAAWGLNLSGSLGDGTTTERYPPVAVNAQAGSALFEKSVVSLSSGGYFTLALCSDGSIAGWGANTVGQLGNFLPSDSSIPVNVYAESFESALFGKTVRSIAAGYAHGMALCTDGTLASWGANYYGVVGIGTSGENTDVYAPVAVSTASGVSHLYGKRVTALPDNSAFASHTVVVFAGKPLEIGLEVLEPTVRTLTNGVDSVDFGVSPTQTVRTLRVSNPGTEAIGNLTATKTGANAGEFSILSQPPATLAPGGSGTFQVAFTPNVAGLRSANLHLTSTDAAGGAFTVAMAATALPPEIDVQVLEPTVQTLADGVGVVDFEPSTLPTRRTIRVTNSGNSTMHGLRVTKSGADMTNFTIVSNPASTLAAGASTTFQVAVSSTTAGTKTAALQIASDDPDENPFDIALIATILPEDIAVDAIAPVITPLTDGTSEVDFGATLAGTVKEFRIRSVGMLPLNGVSASIGGTDASAFTILSQVPAVIPPEREVRFRVLFSPTDSSAKTANLQISSSDPDETVFDVTLRGTVTSTLALSFDGPNDTGTIAYSPDVVGKDLSIALNFAPQPGTNLLAIQNVGPAKFNGEFPGYPNGSTVNLVHNGTHYPFVVWYYGGDGNDLVFLWPYTGLAAWGRNDYGQLGDGTKTSRSTPVATNRSGGLEGKTIVQVARGLYHSLALSSDGQVFAWGRNGNGELGDGTVTDRTTPVPVNTGVSSALFNKKVVAISAGQAFSAALCSDGTIATWGSNLSRELGDGTTVSALTPVAVNSASGTSALFGKSVTSISCGPTHTLALCSDGTIAVWGANVDYLRGAPLNGMIVSAVDNATSALFGRTAASISAGGAFNLALCSDGTLVGWGINDSGQIGDGTSNNTRLRPVALNVTAASALFGKCVTMVTSGYEFGTALCSDGAIVSWGANGSGQLGISTTVNQPFPTQVGISGAKHLATTSSQCLTSTVDDSLFEWGSNVSGTHTAPNLVNVDASNVLFGRKASSLGTSGSVSGHLFAIFGLLPPEIEVEVLEPALLTLADGSGSVDFGSSLPGTIRTLRIKNIGDSELASLSIGKSGDSPQSFTILDTLPSVIPSGASVNVRVAFSGTSDGQKSASLQIASNDFDESIFDIALSGSRIGVLPVSLNSAEIPGFVAEAVFAEGVTLDLSLNFTPTPGASLKVIQNNGSYFIHGTYAGIPNGGTVDLIFNGLTYRYIAWYYGGDGNDLVLVWPYTGLMAWGSNTSGMVGDGSTTQRNTPVATNQAGVLAGKTIVQIARGTNHTLALSSEGRVYAWGSNQFGQLGDGSGISIRVPVAVDMDSPSSALFGKTVVAISAGQTFSLALCSDGTIASWGINSSNQLGDTTATNRSRPVSVYSTGNSALLDKAVVGISAGGSHSLAVCTDGTVVAWGLNSNGQIGDGTTSSRSMPVRVMTSSGGLAGKFAKAVSAGGSHSLALCSDGTVTSWGNSSSGQLGATGVGATPPRTVSTSGVLSGKTVSAIAAGGTYSLALCSDGTLASWGFNGSGQLGDGTTTNKSLPVAVNTTSGSSAIAGRTVTMIAASSATSAALCSDGRIALWGFSGTGQIGDGGTTYRPFPTEINPSGANIVSAIPLSGPVSVTSHAIFGITPPVAIASGALNIRSSSASLTGSINPNGTANSARFEFGTTPGFGTVVPITLAPANGTSPQNVIAPISGLLPRTTYYFRIRTTAGPLTIDSETASFSTGDAPHISLPNTPLLSEATGSSGAVVTFSVTASDSEDGVLVPSVSPASGSVFPIGDTVVNASATDSAGESTNASFIVRVVDTTAPTIFHPDELVAATSPDGANVNFGPHVASDAVGVTEITYSPASGSLFPIGVTPVTITARDAAGNAGHAIFNVKIVPAAPVISEWAIKGAAIPSAGGGNGIPAGAIWETFGTPSLNENGTVALLATYKVGSLKTPAIFVWQANDMERTLRIIAKRGDAISGSFGEVYAAFKDPVLGPGGEIAFLAKVANAPGTNAVNGMNNEGLFLAADASGSGTITLVARKGASAPEAVAPNGSGSPVWTSITSFALGERALFFTAKLQSRSGSASPGPGGVTTENDSGFWVHSLNNVTTHLVLREGDPLLGSTVKTIAALVARPGSPGQGCGVATDGLNDFAQYRVSLADNRHALGYSSQDGLVVLTQVTGGDALGYNTGAKWQSFGIPTQASHSSAVAFLGTVKTGTGNATIQNNMAIFAEDEVDYSTTRIAVKGTAAPGVNAGVFSSFKDPVNAMFKSVAFAATLKTGMSGITAANNDGIWWNDPANGLTLVAREGAQPPGAPEGAQWKAFTSLALPEGRGPIFVATMHSKTGGASPGPGGVTTANDVGLWATDSFGIPRLLLREGNPIGGSTVKTINVLANVLGSPAQARSFDKNGHILARITDSSGAQHLVEVTVP